MGSCIAKKMINNHMEKATEMERACTGSAQIDSDGSILIPFNQMDGCFAHEIDASMLERIGLSHEEYANAVLSIGTHLKGMCTQRNDLVKNAGSLSYALKNQYKGYEIAAEAQKGVTAARMQCFQLNKDFESRKMGMQWSLVGVGRLYIRISFGPSSQCPASTSNGMFQQPNYSQSTGYGSTMTAIPAGNTMTAIPAMY